MRARTLAIGAAVCACSLALPVSLVGAQEPAASSTPTAVQTTSDPSSGTAPSPAASTGATGPTSGGATQVGGTVTATPAGGTPNATGPTASAASPKAAAHTSAANGAAVSILDGSSQSDFRFSPDSVTISPGETVTWTNDGQAPEGHDVKGNGFESGTLQSGQTYSHTFTTPGSYPYICSIHPFMKGTVIVQGKGGGGGGGGGNGSGGGNPDSGGGGGGGSSSAPTTTTPGTTTSPTTGPGSESAAGSSPDAAGTSTQLPSTGDPVAPLAVLGALFLGAGLLLRRRARA